MTRLKNVFAVSFIAIATVMSAHATIVTETMMDNAIGDATLTIQKNGTAVNTFKANAKTDKTINITVGKSDVGLGNVDNTSDANKPISTATQTALDDKQDKANMKKSDAEGLLGAVLESDDYYLSAAATAAVISDALDTRQAGHTSKGSATVPVYFDEYGVAKEIESYSGKAATAGTADNVAWSGVTGKPDASTTTKGIIQIATDSDVSTGTNTTKAVTPAQLKTVASDATDAVKTVKVNNAALTETDGAVDITITEGTGDGTIKVNGSDVSVHGLKSGAYANAYSLPTASSSTKGGVKIGTDIAIANGVISVDKATTVASDNEKPVTSGAVYTAVDKKIDTTVSGDASKVMVRNSEGTYKPAGGTDITITTDATTKAATLNVAHASTADTATSATTAGTADSVAWSGVTGKPDASTTTKGIIQIATDSDVSTGTNTTKAVTPAQLALKANSSSIGDGTLTIKQGGANAQTFTANASSGTTVNITPAKVGAVATADVIRTKMGNGDVRVLDKDNNLALEDSDAHYLTAAATYVVASEVAQDLVSTKADAASISGDTKTKITYNSQGIVTGGGDLQASDIPTLTMAKISDAGTMAKENKTNYYTKTEAGQTFDAINAASTAKSDIETKLGAGSTGYDINAKSLKVQGTSVLTSLNGAVLTSGDQSASGTKTFSGTVDVTGTLKNTGVATAAGKASDRTTAVAAVSNGNVKSAINALESKKEEYANKVGAAADPQQGNKMVLSDAGALESNDKYLTGLAVATAITDALDDRQEEFSDKGSASIPVYFNNEGKPTEITTFGSIASGNEALLKGKTVYSEVRPSATNTQAQGYGYLQNQAVKTNLTALDTAIKTIHPSTGEVKIPSGSATSTTYASIWVE